MKDEEIIKLENVSKTYKMDSVYVHALRNVSLGIRRGELVSIIGPSGSGKSTLLHIMGLLDKPTEGKIVFEGKEVSHLSDREITHLRGNRIGFVFQFYNLYPTLNVEENVELPLIINQIDKKVRKEKAMQLLSLIGMEKRAKHFPAQLSGGERQRVAIARALARDPEIILADEPTGNLDSATGLEILHIFTKLHNEGRTIVIITHDKHIAEHTKRSIEIKDGMVHR